MADIEQFVRQSFVPAASPYRVGIELESIVMPTGDPTGAVAHETVIAAASAIGPLPRGSRITFEPGGQIELSSPPLCGVGTACEALDADLTLLRANLRAAGVEMVGIGLDPRCSSARVSGDPRYRAMEHFFSRDGSEGVQMMRSTAALQINLDIGNAAQQLPRWRLVHAMGPILTAAFANSPFTAGSPNGFRSGRAAIWAGIDPSRTASIDHTGNDPADAWVRYALAARVMLIRVSEQHMEAMDMNLPFLRWMEEGHELGYPTLEDFAYHTTTLFPPVRPRGWLELRMIDSLPDPWWQVAVAVTTALVEDGEAAGAARRATRDLEGHCQGAARHGLAHPGLAHSARSCFQAALSALPRLGVDGRTISAAADFNDRFVARGRCPADDLLDRWHSDGRVLPHQPLAGAWI